MLSRTVLCLCALAAVSSATGYQRWGHRPDVDPLGKHCYDVDAPDPSDPQTAEWLSANEYNYVNWTVGLCDKSIWPVAELCDHPVSASKVTTCRMGHKPNKAPAAAVLASTVEMLPVEMAEADASKDCRNDKTSTPTSIDFTNGAGLKAKIRSCLNARVCKPFVDCELDLEAGATETIVIDNSTQYFIFTFYNGHESEMYPDANGHYPSKYTIPKPADTAQVEILAAEPEADTLVINAPSPGSHAHCTEISFAGGTANAYYKAHGYQYQPPQWNKGPCDKKYNWFNNNSTLAPGVTQTLLGIH